MALKILFCTDLHLRFLRPVSRKDEDFLAMAIDKIDQVRELSLGCDIVIIGGDIFDRPDAAHGVTVEAMDAFKKFTIPVYTVIGNHDIYGYQGLSINKTAMGILLKDEAVIKLDSLFLKDVGIYGLHCYDKTLWDVPESESPKVLVAHKMLTSGLLPGGKGYDLNSITTNADVILSGDCHTPHEAEIDGKFFINPGSLIRLSINDRDRFPQVAIITIEDDRSISYNFHPLRTKPAETLFDLENYAVRMDSEMHTKDFQRTFVEMVISVKGESHTLFPMMVEFFEKNGHQAEMRGLVNEYYDRAEKEVLKEIKE